MSVPAMRMLLQPASPIFAYLDDYWYYIYHDRNYSISVRIVFDSIKFVNEQKLTPQFVDLSPVESYFNISLILSSDYRGYTPIAFFREENTDIQFLRNVQEMYTWNYISGLLMFVLLRLMYKIIHRCCQSENAVMTTVTAYLRENSLYKCILLILIEGNLIFISFFAGLQFFEPSVFNFRDKFNFVFALLFFFAAMIFAFGFYILVYALCSRKNAEIFLSYTRPTLHGYLCETITISLKNLANGIIHAYFLHNYTTQIACLIAVKMLILTAVFVFRKSYLNRLLMFTFALYFTAGITLDLTLFFDKENSSELTPIALTELILIGTLTFAAVLNVLVVLYPTVKEIIVFIAKKCCKSNQISTEMKMK